MGYWILYIAYGLLRAGGLSFYVCLFVCLTDSYCVPWLNFVAQAGLKLLAILFHRIGLVVASCHLQLILWDIVISESA